MIRRLLPAAAAACAIGAVAAGCGVGAGEADGDASIRVTRDAGAELVLEASARVREADSVLDLLDREAELETAYGGGFVQAIEGISGGSAAGRPVDWFFFVNGVESGVGSAEFDGSDADAIWWDHRDWSGAMRVPAVVGSFPQPFADGYAGERWTTSVRCADPGGPVCARVTEALGDAGAELSGSDAQNAPGTLPGESDEDVIRVLVGTWDELRADPLARRLEAGPERSGVFARLTRDGGEWEIERLGFGGEPAGSGPGGLVAALRDGRDPPAWVITGTGAAGLSAAAAALSPELLRDSFALTLPAGGEPVAVPVAPGGEVAP